MDGRGVLRAQLLRLPDELVIHQRSLAHKLALQLFWL